MSTAGVALPAERARGEADGDKQEEQARRPHEPGEAPGRQQALEKLQARAMMRLHPPSLEITAQIQSEITGVEVSGGRVGVSGPGDHRQVLRASLVLD